MHSPIVATAWELWARNRIGILTAYGSIPAVALAGAFMPAAAAKEDLVLLSATVFMIQYLYVVLISINPEFRFQRAQAGFPAWKFTLPVKTSTLVAVHMSFGLGMLISFWVLSCWLIWLPGDIQPSWGIPGLLSIYLVWIQAVCWCFSGRWWAQLGVSGLVICVLWPCVKFLVNLILFLTQNVLSIPSTPLILNLDLMIVVLPVIGVAFSLAQLGVGYARHGRGQSPFYGTGNIRVSVQIGGVKSPKPFFSSSAAQLWYELHRIAPRFLPCFGVVWLIFLGLAVSPVRNADSLFNQFGFFLIVMLLAALCVGYGLGKAAFWGDLDCVPWDAARPVSSGAIALAKIRTAALTALATWLLLLAVAPFWFWFAGAGRIAIEHWKRLVEAVGIATAIGLNAAVVVALVALTWGQIVGGLCLALTRSRWIVNGVAGLGFMLVAAFGLSWRFASVNPEIAPSTWMFWTGLAGILVILKVSAAVWSLWLANRRELIDWKQLLPSLGFWSLGLGCLLVTLHVYVPLAIGSVPEEQIGLGPLPPLLTSLLAILSLPLVRLTAAPLAVAVNRHR